VGSVVVTVGSVVNAATAAVTAAVTAGNPLTRAKPGQREFHKGEPETARPFFHFRGGREQKMKGRTQASMGPFLLGFIFLPPSLPNPAF
jgi:hypothetical protein